MTLSKKGKDSRFIKNMRPITLLNTDYKLIEKVLANRIKPHLYDIIHEDQKGFMQHRRISSNIRCILDLIDRLDSTDEEGIILSVDYEKCFDRIEWQAIDGSLKMFNFGPGIHNGFEILYQGASVQVVNNGHLSERVKITRGCRQGAPCSPYIFVICTELLAIALRENKDITGFPINDFNKFFGQYADDMDIYCKTNQTNLDTIHCTLSDYCQSSGCKINYEKTTLYRIGKDNKALAGIYTRNMRIEQNHINVLGVNVTRDTDKLCHINYNDLLNKVKGLLGSWQNRQLYLLSKITIINSLVTSLFVYKMYVLPNLTDQYVNKLNKIIENFLWNG